MIENRITSLAALVFLVLILVVVLLSYTFTEPVRQSPPMQGSETSTPSSPAPTITITPVSTIQPTLIRFTDTPTPSPTITPTFVMIIGRVNADLLTCRMGPGPYVRKVDLYRNKKVQVIGRNTSGDWLYVSFQTEAEIFNCWVESRRMDLNGVDIENLKDSYPGGGYQLPIWEAYLPPQDVRIARSENFVDIRWEDANLLALSERDGPLGPRFLLEAWVCRDGQLEFASLGVVENTNLVIEDQRGCEVPSTGRLFAAGKNGYSRAVDLEWPAP